MPNLRNLTIKIRTKFSSPASSASTTPSTSPTIPSFEVISGKKISNTDAVHRTPPATDQQPSYTRKSSSNGQQPLAVIEEVEPKDIIRKKQLEWRTDSFQEESEWLSVPVQNMLKDRAASVDGKGFVMEGGRRRSKFREELV
jgi:hypothetical protein